MCIDVTFKDTVPIIQTVFTIVGSIVGVLLGQRIGKKTAIEISNLQFENSKKLADNTTIETKKRDEELRRRFAIAELKSAFAPAIARYSIQSSINDGKNISSVLRDELPEQAKAIELFKPFIRPERITEYEKAWKDYQETEKYGPRFGEYEQNKGRFNKAIIEIMKFSES